MICAKRFIELNANILLLKQFMLCMCQTVYFKSLVCELIIANLKLKNFPTMSIIILENTHNIGH